ncbi:hypothetical protein [Bacillus sp. ISL-7]|uniref:hypothetical protein n=1 Tax=Bacillus sp. ISL-7 TaxID=2819136 RepID=UPI001BEB0D2B|nr:hypothetical protein [Bacillus sp. ISL-7]MBT2738115.1 hypothetical protein [Bacillus sp. ISL-7]
MKNVTVAFKTSPQIAQLIEAESLKQGYRNKSEFLTNAIMDSLAGLEATRHKDTISDFLDIISPSIASRINDKDRVNDLINDLKVLQRVYIKERLTPHMRLQKHLTDTAVQSFLEGDSIVEQTGIDGFIVNSCLQAIYDKMASRGIISFEEWEEATQHYSMYMEHGEGLQLLKQTE